MKNSPSSSLLYTSTSTSSSSSSSSSTSTSSIEAPKGCLRFFLSSNSNANTKPTDKKKRTPCRIYHWSSSSSSAKPKSKPFNHYNTPTPPTNVHNSSTTASAKNNTPPIQPSLSPEIQQQPLLHKQHALSFDYGSSSSAAAAAMTSTSSIATPCYAAGHVLSGVSDKRKCRPRGILSVIDNDCVLKGNVFDTVGDNPIDNTAAINNALTVSTPREASVHWLLSPCKEEEEGGNNYAGFRRLEEGSLPLHFSSASPSSGYGISLDTTSTPIPTPTPTPIPTPIPVDTCNRNGRRRNLHLSSPPVAGELLQFHGFLGPLFDSNDLLWPVPTSRITDHITVTPKEGRRRCNSANNSLSVDSLSGGNVIRTPNSDSGSESWVGLPLQCHTAKCKADQVDSELNPCAGTLDNKKVSSESHFSTWDAASSSFQFDELDTPMDSIDLTLFQKVLNSDVSWVSNSTVDNNISQSNLRISWRDGLASRIFDMDEYDSCRYLSDDGGDAVVSSPQLKPCQSPPHDAETGNGKNFNHASDQLQLLDSKIQSDQPGKENCPPKVPSLCVESLSLDGNGLIASSDSDWNSCYKNKLFEV